MSGGCQGCVSSQATLRQGIEVMVRRIAPEIVEIVDITDHAAGTTHSTRRSRSDGLGLAGAVDGTYTGMCPRRNPTCAFVPGNSAVGSHPHAAVALALVDARVPASLHRRRRR